MADPEAVELVKEALASGKTEQEVIALMKQAGYTDQAVSEVMAEIRGQPGDELARAVAEKNRIPLAQDAPRRAAAQPAMQPMPSARLSKTRKIILAVLAVIAINIAVLWFLFPSLFSFS